MMNFIEYKTFEKTAPFFSLKPSRAHFVLIVTLIVVFVFAILFATFAPMDDIIKTSVIIRPQDSISIVRCIQEGELNQKFYENGSQVCKGNLLFSLDATALQLELETTKTQLTLVDENSSIFKLLLETMKSEQHPSISKETEAYRRSAMYLFEKEYYEQLAKDIKIKLDRELAKPKALTVFQNIQDLQVEYDKAILQYNTWKNSQTLLAIEQYKQLLIEKRDLETRISFLKRSIKNTILEAPISGCITEIRKLNIGDYIVPGEEIVKIIPDSNDFLKAELIIDPAFIARVTEGKDVVIRFPGLPPSRFGQLTSKITLVPPDYTTEDSNHPVFIAESEIIEPWLISRQGEKIELLPGMTAEGRIIIEQSTILRMILRKLDFLM